MTASLLMVASGGVSALGVANAAHTASRSGITATPSGSSSLAVYTLTVVNGTESGQHEPGTEVNITADTPPEGHEFDSWFTSDGGSFENAAESTTTYTMPANDATVTASFVLIPTPFAGGFGTEENPYQIADIDQLQAIDDVQYRDKHFVLINDIDASDTVNWNDGAGFDPIGHGWETGEVFTGTFEGQGHTVSGLVINRQTMDFVSLFGVLAEDGEVREVGMVGGTISGGLKVGGLVAWNYGGTIEKSFSTAEVTGHTQGGWVGGLVAYNWNATGNEVADCYAMGSVTGASRDQFIGGLIGQNDGTVTNSYATGTVDGDSYVGGLVGTNAFGTITASYYDSATTGQSDTGKGVPKSTAEMKQQATFADWDFANTWTIVEGVTYPRLQWQPIVPPVVQAPGVSSNPTPTWQWESGGGSGVYRYQLDSTSSDGWGEATTATSYTPATALDDGSHTLYVQEQDKAENWSDPGSDIVTIDTQAPVGGTVNDGAGEDIDSQLSTSTITANWSAFTDDGSGIAAYEWAIGTASGDTDVQAWASVGDVTEASNKDLTLVPGQMYYVSVRALDLAGNACVPVSSDGVIVPDSDTDGLPDHWEMTHFGNLDQSDDGDPDGDGYSNAEELFAQTDPNRFTSEVAYNWKEGAVRLRIIGRALKAYIADHGEDVFPPGLLTLVDEGYLAADMLLAASLPDDWEAVPRWDMLYSETYEDGVCFFYEVSDATCPWSFLGYHGPWPATWYDLKMYQLNCGRPDGDQGGPYDHRAFPVVRLNWPGYGLPRVYSSEDEPTSRAAKSPGDLSLNLAMDLETVFISTSEWEMQSNTVLPDDLPELWQVQSFEMQVGETIEFPLWCPVRDVDDTLTFELVDPTGSRSEIPGQLDGRFYSYEATLESPPSFDVQCRIKDGDTVIDTMDFQVTVGPSVLFSADTATVAEDAGTVTLTCLLSQVQEGNVTVPFSLSGTADAGESLDYTVTPASSIVIPAGQTSGQVVIAIADDTLFEGDETIVVTLGAPTSVGVGSPSEMTVTITDNDPMIEGVHLVDCNAEGIGNGLSWANPFTDLQDALDAAGDGDEIWVAAGTYVPSVEVNAGGEADERCRTFQLKNGVALYGGFTGDETDREQRDWEANVSVLSGDIGVVDDSSDNCYHVVVGNDDAILDGFTVTMGCASGEGELQDQGGGMINDGVSPVVANCSFVDNSSALSGGGMYNIGNAAQISGCIFERNSSTYGGGMDNHESTAQIVNCEFRTNDAETGMGGGVMNGDCSSSLLITGCTFTGNSASSGAGICNYTASPVIEQSVFTDNAASYRGGGIANQEQSNAVIVGCSFVDNTATNFGAGVDNSNQSSPVVTHCVFRGNDVTAGDGGAVCAQDSSAVLANCVFVGNRASTKGGAIYTSQCQLFLTNCTVVANHATSAGGGVYTTSSSEEGSQSSPRLTNCIVWGNTALNGSQISNTGASSAVTYSCIEGGYTGTGNIDTDPQLEDSDGPDTIVGTEDDDLRLRSDSPCIDAGDNGAPNLPTTDLDGKVRRIDDPNTADTGTGMAPIVDIGAFEYGTPSGPVIRVSGNGVEIVPADTTPTVRDGTEFGDVLVGAGTVTHRYQISNVGMSDLEVSGITLSGDHAADFTVADIGLPVQVATRASVFIDVTFSPLLSGVRNAVIEISSSGAIASTYSFSVTGFGLVSGDIYVDDSAAGDGDGSSWEYAFTELQAALRIAGPGATIHVAEGVYKPSAEVGGTGGRYWSFQLKNGVTLLGGYPDGGGERAPAVHPSICCGDIGVEGDASDNCYHVFHHPYGLDLDQTAVLDGFTLTGGNAVSPESEGGGMLNAFSSPKLVNCTFTDNSAESLGGGMANRQNSAPILLGCRFVGNSAASGGAFSATGQPPELPASPTLINCLFTGNKADNYGGAVYLSSSSPALINCTFVANSATSAGGAMYCLEASIPTVTNCIFWGNVASDDRQISNEASDPVVTYSCIQGGHTGAGNLDTDPLFVDADGVDNVAGTEDDDLHLLPESPCIDAGDNEASSLGDIDLAGTVRRLDAPDTPDTGNGAAPIVDMGAYEFNPDSDGDGLLDTWEDTYFGNLSKDGTGDTDDDGLLDAEEYEMGTNPTAEDTDEDNVPDAMEVYAGSDPVDPASRRVSFTVHISMSGEHSGELTFGLSHDGTVGFDQGLDHVGTVEPSSGQAVGCLYDLLASPDEAAELTSDFRPFADTVRWRLLVEFPEGRGSAELCWSVQGAEKNKRIFVQEIRDEQPVGPPIDAQHVSSCPIEGDTVFELAYSVPSVFQLPPHTGWALVGLPVMTTQSAGELLDDLSRGATGSCQLWNWEDGQYRSVDGDAPWVPERGYWVFSATGAAPQSATGIVADGVMRLQPGWNLISPAVGFSIEQHPQITGIWRWDSIEKRYRSVPALADTVPGVGYWVFVASDTDVELHAGALEDR